MISTLIQIGKLTRQIEEIDKKLKAIQEDLLILKVQYSKPPESWGPGFSLGDK
jgi:hypothetical protein